MIGFPAVLAYSKIDAILVTIFRAKIANPVSNDFPNILNFIS